MANAGGVGRQLPRRDGPLLLRKARKMELDGSIQVQFAFLDEARNAGPR
jgi:hypothetical protein